MSSALLMLIVDAGLMGRLGFIILFLLLCLFEYFYNKILKINKDKCIAMKESMETHHVVKWLHWELEESWGGELWDPFL